MLSAGSLFSYGHAENGKCSRGPEAPSGSLPGQFVRFGYPEHYNTGFADFNPFSENVPAFYPGQIHTGRLLWLFCLFHREIPGFCRPEARGVRFSVL